MLKDMLNVPTTDLESSSDVSAAPTEIERRRAVLAFVVRLLDEDLHCWVRLLNCQEAQPSPSARLRQKLDIPLVARLFWPQSDAGRFNFVCRELVSLHSSAVVCEPLSCSKLFPNVDGNGNFYRFSLGISKQCSSVLHEVVGKHDDYGLPALRTAFAAQDSPTGSINV